MTAERWASPPPFAVGSFGEIRGGMWGVTANGCSGSLRLQWTFWHRDSYLDALADHHRMWA